MPRIREGPAGAGITQLPPGYRVRADPCSGSNGNELNLARHTSGWGIQARCELIGLKLAVLETRQPRPVLAVRERFRMTPCSIRRNRSAQTVPAA